MANTYIYRVIKSSWGIWIAITARVDSTMVVTPNMDPTDPVCVRFEGPTESLPDELKQQIRKGLAIIEERIVDALKGAAVTVTIEDVSYNETDFQAEGLAVAIIRWTERELELPKREIIETFSKADNRYRFTFP